MFGLFALAITPEAVVIVGVEHQPAVLAHTTSLGQLHRALPLVLRGLFDRHFVQVEEQLEVPLGKLLLQGLKVQLSMG